MKHVIIEFLIGLLAVGCLALIINFYEYALALLVVVVLTVALWMIGHGIREIIEDIRRG